ncbi:hypothetical protein TNCV_483991 [Trichonephila clavipes]|nr:hypothetical protein TNCV_483991 [Trichonephila clavipes]
MTFARCQGFHDTPETRDCECKRTTSDADVTETAATRDSTLRRRRKKARRVDPLLHNGRQQYKNSWRRYFEPPSSGEEGTLKTPPRQGEELRTDCASAPLHGGWHYIYQKQSQPHHTRWRPFICRTQNVPKECQSERSRYVLSFSLSSVHRAFDVTERVSWKKCRDSAMNCGRGSGVVKVSDHGRNVTNSSLVPLKTRRVGQRCTLNLSRAQSSSLGVPSGREFEPSTAEDPPCRRGRCALNLLRLKRPSFGMVWKLEEGVVLVTSPWFKTKIILGAQSLTLPSGPNILRYASVIQWSCSLESSMKTENAGAPSVAKNVK